MARVQRFLFFSIFSSVLLLFLFSCENSVPEVVSVNALLVCDYQDEDNVPSFRLSVFAESSSDVRRAASLKITNKENGYEWRIDNPVIVSGNNREWVGHTFIVYPNRSRIKMGTYDVTYTDAAGKTKDTSFSLSYPEEIFSAKAKDVSSLLGENKKEYVAIFSGDGTLIYYDSRKRDWTADDNIFSANEDASFFRVCYVDGQNNLLCMMPPVLRDIN